MAAPAVVAGDRILVACGIHQVPGPGGGPVPAPAPLPFSAPLSGGLVDTVLIGGRSAAVQGSEGVNSPPHPGLHASDRYAVPSTQTGRVVAGSTTVLIGNRGAAYSGCPVAGCAGVPGQVTGSATTVLIGG